MSRCVISWSCGRICFRVCTEFCSYYYSMKTCIIKWKSQCQNSFAFLWSLARESLEAPETIQSSANDPRTHHSLMITSCYWRNRIIWLQDSEKTTLSSELASFHSVISHFAAWEKSKKQLLLSTRPWSSTNLPVS